MMKNDEVGHLKLRNKFVLGIALIVVFMASVFIFLSNGVVSHQFRQYAVAAEQNSAAAWGNQLIWYYETHDHSWNGLQDFLFYSFQYNAGGGANPEYLDVFSGSGSQVATIQLSHNGPTDSDGMVTVPLIVQGQKIGTLHIQSHGLDTLFEIKRNVVHSIMLVTLLVTLLTAIVALGIAVWFSNRFTHPLEKLLEGIHRITKGNLETEVTVTTSDEVGKVATAFNNMAVQLKRTEEARRHLVADVAHELRTPLTIINGQLELIQQGVKPNDVQSLLPIHDEVSRLTRLVNDLHQLTIAEAGKLVLNKQPTNLTRLIERIVENFQIDSEDSEISLTFENYLENVDVSVDAHRITQVVINLIGNALRYTPRAGQVTVIIDRVKDFVRLSINDTGPGIPPDHQDHVFDRFYRVDEDRARETGGTGLGLAIAKEFVEAHNGTIELVSTVGVGSSFTVRLPLI